MSNLEKHYNECKTLTILIHGLEGSKLDWLEKNSFTKGGNLTEILNKNKISWIACDLYGHGDFTANEKDFDKTNIIDEIWPKFISESSNNIKRTLNKIKNIDKYKNLKIISYSSGCHIAVKLLKDSLPLPVSIFIMAVPTPEKEYDDEYSLHNNLDVFTNKTIGIFCGTNDDIVSQDETVWFYNKIPGNNKFKRDYNSGHSLPVQWVYDVYNNLK